MSRISIVFLVATICASSVYAASNGKYEPDSSGKYTHSVAGQYSGDNRGSYRPNLAKGFKREIINANTLFNIDSDFIKYAAKMDAINTREVKRAISLVRPLSRLAAPSKIDPTKPPKKLKKLKAGENTDNTAEVIRHIQELHPEGYYYTYETENDIVAGESGKLKNLGTPEEAMQAEGYYQYIGDDGKKYRVDYTADENGFVAKGDHLPTPPPIPPLILKALRLYNPNY